jgi:hypothetical protein
MQVVRKERLNTFLVRFEILMDVFWDIMPCVWYKLTCVSEELAVSIIKVMCDDAGSQLL